jgi:NADH:ubiquinone oxidoreductase subunit 6 (subunit J)
LSSEALAAGLAAALVLTAVAALGAKKVSTSLIMLFYSSVVLGVTFTLYDDALVGLVHMATFAGAVSVLLLTVILMTGKSDLAMGGKRLALVLTGVTALIVVASLSALTSGASASAPLPAQDISLQVLGFIWNFRPWDLLVLIMVFASSMVAVVSLLSRERQ